MLVSDRRTNCTRISINIRRRLGHIPEKKRRDPLVLALLLALARYAGQIPAIF